MTYVTLRQENSESVKSTEKHSNQKNIDLTNKASYLWMLLFGWLMLDSMVIYFLPGKILFPVNGLLPVLIVVVYFLQNKNKKLLPMSVLFWLLVLFIGYISGAVLDVNPYGTAIKKNITSISAFIIGYNAIIKNTDYDKLLNVFIAVGLLYSVICVLALLGVSKSLFPVVYAYGFNEGVPIVRAEVTTDQNYQIYYLFPPMLAIARKQSALKYGLILMAFVGALYAVVQLQTRSGLILLFLAALIPLLIPVWYRVKFSVNRVWVIVVGIVLLLLFKLPAIIEFSSSMISRFTNSDMGTFWGRVHSFTYLFEKVYNPVWWLPQGMGEFLKATGNFPHSSSTVVFLQGGILSLAAWVVLVFFPPIKGVYYILKRKGDCFTSLIIVGGLISMVAAMSLPAPLFEQVWLWLGATSGVLYNINKKN